MYGGPQLRPYVVEFIRGTGVRVNGVVVQDSGGNGPFSWVLPDDVAQLENVVVGGGGVGGQGGGDIASPLSLGGGAGGQAGYTRLAERLRVRPGSTLTVTVGAGGTAGAVNGSGGGNGGASSIAGLLPGFGSMNADGTILLCPERTTFMSAAQASASAVATNGGNMATSAQGTDGQWNGSTQVGQTIHDNGTGNAAGGGGAAAGAVGFPGGIVSAGFGSLNGIDFASPRSSGSNVGGVSRGGGGLGCSSIFGRGGLGGSNAAGGNSPNYCSGGGGGAGGFPGGTGGDGYVGFTYWSAR